MDNQNQPLQSIPSNPIMPANKNSGSYVKINWMKWLLIYFVIAILIYGGAYLFLSRRTSKPYSINHPLPTITIQPTSTSDKTSNWKTYRNEEFGFEVRYPENFQLNVEKEVISITSKKAAECKTGASGAITEGTYAELQLRFISHSGMSYETIWKTIFGSNFDNNSYDGIKEIGGRDAYYFYETAEMPMGKKVYLVRQTSDHALEIDIDFPGIIFDCNPSLMHGNDAEKLGDQILSTFRFVDKKEVGLQTQTPTSCLHMTPRWIPKKPVHTTITSGHYQDHFLVQFADGTGIRLREEKFVSLSNINLTDLYEVLKRFEVKIERLYTREEEKDLEMELLALETKTCKEMADFNLAYIFRVPSEQDNEKFIDLLNMLSVVELAEPSAIPVNP